METGLRHRLKRVVRQMGDQHRHLKALYAELGTALRDEAHPAALASFARYREAIDAHFALESEVVFPAVHGLEPRLGPELEALEREHALLGAALGAVQGKLERDPRAGAEALASFVATLREHEAREEGIVGRVEG